MSSLQQDLDCTRKTLSFMIIFDRISLARPNMDTIFLSKLLIFLYIGNKYILYQISPSPDFTLTKLKVRDSMIGEINRSKLGRQELIP